MAGLGLATVALPHSSIGQSTPLPDPVAQLCPSWQALCLASSASSAVSQHAVPAPGRQASPGSGCGDDEEASARGDNSWSSCSSAASLAKTVGAGPDTYSTPARRGGVATRLHSLSLSRSRSRFHSGDDLSYMVHGDLEEDKSCDTDSSNGDEGIKTESWFVDQCDAANYQRFENVDLVLPASDSRQSPLFWEHTASNLEWLMALGPVERCSLVVRDMQGDQAVEVELDASRLHSAHALDVCGLRIRADVDTMHAHCADCVFCATMRGAASEEWSVWWSRALCLADYMCFLNAHNPPCEMMNNIQDVECDGGFDLAFLID